MIDLLRTKFRRIGYATLVATAITVTPSYAQNYPAKSIRLIVPFAPGGGNDVLGRMFALRMSESLGQSVIVDNRPGGGGRTRAVNRAPACGM